MELNIAKDNSSMASNCFTFKHPQQPNFVLAFDDMGYDNPFNIQFEFTVKKTLIARIKYWLFCKFFPFKIRRWDK